jgi:UDP-GlcNAc3NAcA epimerase
MNNSKTQFTIARIVGARPQFMQVPAVLAELERRGLKQILIHTGQHYDAALSAQFFLDLGLPAPDVDLGVGSHTQGAATGRMLEKLEAYLYATKPDAIIVDGDTNSTLAGALAGAKMLIPVFHIEAGIRDWDRRRPEEINRIVTDHISSLNFAPIPRALDNLRSEALGDTSHLAGDVLLDCYVRYRPKATSVARSRLKLEPERYHVLTLHRPENTDLDQMPRFHEIISALKSVDLPVIFPMHPRTRRVWTEWLRMNPEPANIKVIEPVGYLEMLDLVGHCDCVFTDSGGLSREAVWSERRCVMLFLVDTWHDLLERRWARIGKTDAASVTNAFNSATRAPADAIAFFGGGQAASRIGGLVSDFLNARDRSRPA